MYESNDYTSEVVSTRVNALSAIADKDSTVHHSDDSLNKKHSDKHHHQKRTPLEMFLTLVHAATVANETLSATGALFRFKVYKNNNSVMLDIVKLDTNQKVVSVTHRDVTNEDFDKLIEDVSISEGLAFDATV